MISDPEKLKRIYEEKFCEICGRVYYVPRNKRRGRRPVGIRPRNSKTCSKPCSRIKNKKS